MSLARQPESTSERPRRRVTARDVAQAAGVSVAVVSYAFSRPDRVAAATRERVLATASALGYPGPDAAARALRRGARGAVAVVSGGSLEALLADPAAVLVTRGVARACDRAGLSMTLASDEDVVADGEVVLPGSPDATHSRPRVFADMPAPPGTLTVGTRVDEGAAEAARHLIDLGHRRIAVIARPGDARRLDGARRGGASAQLLVVEAAGTSRADGEVAARHALGAATRPSAILALSDLLAWGALEAVRSMGLRAAAEISVVGIDDLPESHSLGLTTVLVPYVPLGELAAGLLLGALSGEARPTPPRLPTPLVVRATSGPAPLIRRPA